VKYVVLLFVCLGVNSAVASSLNFDRAWARATPPGATTAAVYGTVHNTGDHKLELISVSSEWAGMAMIHRSKAVDGMMRMQHVEVLNLDPQSQQVFGPGGLHVMLVGLTRALIPGDRMPLTLHLKSGEVVNVEVRVGKISQMAYPEN
jgi:periplasmic copper chaperone A